ncbi:MAG: gliding motility-associated ABC transporter substrate-binding protein GldG [Salinivirgaceae bacterium]|nr:gliding motility-associated ABC transporter substrate-binding protein GldG [Salinivirgaceae bacterium]
MMQRKKIRQENINQLGITLVIIILLGIISSYIFTRIDLTSDKRYTLSENTKTLLKETEDIVYFKIYLTGDLPAGFIRLENATREILDEFSAYGKDNIQYEFIDPAENPDKKTRNKFFNQLYKKGLNPINLKVKEKDGANSQKYIIPGIIVSYKGKELPVNILKQYVGNSPEGNLNASIQALEYELTFAIHQLTSKRIPKIGFLKGHGELSNMELNDIAQTLSEYYQIEGVFTDEYLYSLRDSLGANIYDLIVIAKPQNTFSEKDKFLIDQYIMNGGRTLWLVDNVKVDLDSLAYSRSTLAIINNLNLDDQLFKYGVRINSNLIQDMQCAVIPVNTAIAGQEAKFAPAPWIFSPLLTPMQNHPITRNLDMIKSEFASSIDTVGENVSVKKSVLLTSSKYSRTANAPSIIDLSIVDAKLNPDQFNNPFLLAGILLEGSFNSVFTNRPAPIKKRNILVAHNSQPTKMIVISDGDIIKNQVRGVGENTETLPLGYDRFTKQTFGNKELLINCINYLCDMDGLLQARTKEHKLRMLDKPKINKQRLKWQLINVLLPIMLIILSSLVYSYIRKKRYSKK